MNPGFRDLATGAFKSGLAKLDKDPCWHDDRTDLDGPFRLGFSGAQGWGEDLLVASLLKRHAVTSNTPVKVFANWQVYSMLKHDRNYHAEQSGNDAAGRPPLAILRQALLGELLKKPFVPLSVPEPGTTSKPERRLRVGIAWASVSNNRCISEKSVPPEEFLPLLRLIDADFVSLQRQLAVADPNSMISNSAVLVLAEEVLNAKTEKCLNELVKTIKSLDYIVTISTTTTHIAAAMGIRVELIASERKGQQWFWQVQAKHQKCLYPTVTVHLGDGRKAGWWKKSLKSVQTALSNNMIGAR